MQTQPLLPSKPQEWDGDWRLIEYDPHTQISEWWLLHDDQKSFTIRRIQHNTQAILNANREERNDNAGRRWGDCRKVATIPLIYFDKLGLNQAMTNGDGAYLRKILNDGDFANFRTFDGRI